MRVLFYNWIQFDKANNSGGGVNVYQKNVIDYLINNSDIDVYFLSSGIYYDMFSNSPRLVETDNVFGDRCHTFKLYNSSCMAPVKAIYDNISTYLEDSRTYDIFRDFVVEKNFDVIHFNNIEGLPLKCLQIKSDFPSVKVIYSLHNYFMFCPQVNLFYNNTHTCEGCTDGEKCSKCLAGNIGGRQFKLYYKIDTILERLHLEAQSDRVKNSCKNLYNKFRSHKQKTDMGTIGNPDSFERFVHENVKTLNENVDKVIAVSDRVRDIAIKNGVNNEKVSTLYIGTKVAEDAATGYHGRTDENVMTIAFMGYFEKFKGLEFLVSTLENIPESEKKRIAFKCYARRKNDADDSIIERVTKLDESFVKSEYYDGYNHSELPKIMSEIDIGIVPVLWEDNLPQVAIEFAAYGVPVLASDLGGAHELSKSDAFVFRAGDEEDFRAKLLAITNNPLLLNEYFENRIKLNSVRDHMETLLKIYSEE